MQYLEKKKVHNVLYADYDTAVEYLERYPGDDYVVVMGTDIYQFGPAAEYEKMDGYS